jgi:hypothetical protein
MNQDLEPEWWYGCAIFLSMLVGLAIMGIIMFVVSIFVLMLP